MVEYPEKFTSPGTYIVISLKYFIYMFYCTCFFTGQSWVFTYIFITFYFLATFGRFDANKQSGIKLSAVRDNIASVCILCSIYYNTMKIMNVRKKLQSDQMCETKKQTSKEENRQTSKQTHKQSKQTIEQINKQLNKQANKQTSKQTNK